MTIAGSVYVASLCFLVMGCWYPYLNSESLAKLFQPYLTYLAVAAVVISYIVGFVVHRLIQIAISILEHWTKGRDRKKYSEDVSKELQARLGEEERIWALSPPRIQREVDFQFAQLALLRSLALSVPFLLISIIIWRLRTGQGLWSYTNWIFFVVFYTFLIAALVRQSLQNKTIRDAAILRAKAAIHPPCTPSDALVTIKGIKFGETDGNCTVTFDGLKIDPPLVQINKLIPRLSHTPVSEGTRVTIEGIIFGTTKEECTVAVDGGEYKPPEVWEPTCIAVIVSKPKNPDGDTKVNIVVMIVSEQKFKLQLTCPPFTVPK